MNLGENIYRLRTQKNMSQGDLADALEVSRQSVSKWENNSAVPELDKLKKMSQLFGVTLDELVSGEKSPEPEPTPPPTVLYVEKRSPIPRNRLLGIILLVCGLAFFIGFTVLGYFIDFILLGTLISFPFIFNGIICLLADRHTVFALCWGNYILFFLFNFFITINRVVGTVDPTIIVSLVLLVALVVWSISKLRKGHWGDSRVKKIVWTVILSILLFFHLWLTLDCIFSNETITFDEDNYSYIEAEKEAYASTEGIQME